MNAPSTIPLIRSLRIQARIIHALIMREIITRYGRHNIGFAWLFAEPMLFTIGVMALWSVAHDANPNHHINIVSFALTSYSTLLVWRNGIGRCALAIEPNASLLFHRNVRVIDLFFARLALEIGGVTLSTVTLMFGLVAAGIIDPPVDIVNMVIGWGLLAWYTCAMGLIIGGLTEYSEVVDRIWHPLAYFQIPVSGAFVMTSYLPPKARDIVMLFPVSHCTELFRYGYFGSQVTPYYSIPYVCTWCLVLTWLGFLVVRGASKRVEMQ
ncbi:ABC transporter permease [Pararobbsia alpina]|uniref:Polysialic acid transport protein KpsM n=1 Tax=Pararobbsia alpina TaxID=621374 RepID=A0A6S7B7V9_9BURK|nr:ABC transporter permease [Pararobbsia alpina]CAB3782092.1 Polysialic acid transport protein KpsM [Pararobbsia alpina]